MKKILLLVSALVLLGAGCLQSFTNDDIIRETKKCEESGLKPEKLVNIDGVITGLQCSPK